MPRSYQLPPLATRMESIEKLSTLLDVNAREFGRRLDEYLKTSPVPIGRRSYVEAVLGAAVPMGTGEYAREYARRFIDREPAYLETAQGKSALRFETWLLTTANDLAKQFVETVVDLEPTFLIVFEGVLPPQAVLGMKEQCHLFMRLRLMVEAGQIDKETGEIAECTLFEGIPVASPELDQQDAQIDDRLPVAKALEPELAPIGTMPMTSVQALTLPTPLPNTGPVGPMDSVEDQETVVETLSSRWGTWAATKASARLGEQWVPGTAVATSEGVYVIPQSLSAVSLLIDELHVEEATEAETDLLIESVLGDIGRSHGIPVKNASDVTSLLESSDGRTRAQRDRAVAEAVAGRGERLSTAAQRAIKEPTTMLPESYNYPLLRDLASRLSLSTLSEASISRFLGQYQKATPGNGIMVLSADRSERSPHENNIARAKMEQMLRSHGLGFTKMRGMWQDSPTSPASGERSYWVPNVPRDKADKIAKLVTHPDGDYKQQAVLHVDHENGAHLLYHDKPSEFVGKHFGTKDIPQIYSQWRSRAFSFDNSDVTAPVRGHRVATDRVADKASRGRALAAATVANQFKRDHVTVPESVFLIYEPGSQQDVYGWAATLRGLCDSRV